MSRESKAKATEQLRKEHSAVKVMVRVLDRLCKRLEAGEKIDPDHLDGIIEFFQVFVDRCHHAKEENMLFVAMQKTTDPSDGDRIGALIKDHVSGRKYIQDLSKAAALYRKGDSAAVSMILQSARHYMTLLIQHIDIEDNVLYPIADSRLSGQKQEELLIEFDRLEEQEIGTGKHDEFHRLIYQLKGIYLS
jgi:hemerythrin-like domain-containing protein